MHLSVTCCATRHVVQETATFSLTRHKPPNSYQRNNEIEAKVIKNKRGLPRENSQLLISFVNIVSEPPLNIFFVCYGEVFRQQSGKNRNTTNTPKFDEREHTVFAFVLSLEKGRLHPRGP